MNASMIFSIVSLLYVAMTVLVFFNKEKIKSTETKIYSALLITTFAGLLIEIISTVFFIMSPEVNIIEKILFRLILLYFGTWGYVFYLYLKFLNIDNLPKEKKQKKYRFMNVYSAIYFVLMFVCCFFLPIYVKFDESNKAAYTYGPSVSYLYILVGIELCFAIAAIISNMKKGMDKRLVPAFLFLALGSIVMIIQYYNPSLLLIASSEALITVLMYHTIENPDVKLVEYEQKEREKVIAAANSKNEFLSNMAHELRTPLNAIVGLSDDIQTFDNKIFVDVKEDSKDLVYASNLLLDIISNILDASKIESGKLDVVETDYYAKREIEAVAKLYEIKAKDKNITFNFEMSESIPRVLFGDKLRILQILNILLDNAVKFTNVGKVTFSISWSDVTNYLSIRISDSGIGMSQEQVDNIMIDVDSLEVDKVYSDQGTGLNLIIAKKLAGILGGKLELESKEMAGTIVTLAIPQRIGSEEKLFELARLERADLSELNVKGKRILVVDDNPLNIKVLRRTIKDYGFDIEESHNGKDAIEKIELNNNYDVVLMDILMPVMNGEEAIKALKEKQNFNTPVIALTADAASGSSVKYTKMGFDDYIPKPFTKEIVSQKLYKVFSERGDINA